MPNHVHIIAVPQTAEAIADTLRPLHMRYTQRINQDHGWRGTLWQGRFYSCAMEEQHVWAAIRYVERNPVRAGHVARPEEYLWSSAPAHCGLRPGPALAGASPHPLSTRKWSEWVNAPDEDAVAALIRQRTAQGRPLGDDEFVSRMSQRLGRSLHAPPRGRPKRGTQPLS